MSSNDSENQEAAAPIEVNEDLILDLNFVPQWARKPPDKNYFEDNRFEKDDRRRDRGGRQRQYRDSGNRERRRTNRPMNRRENRPDRDDRRDHRRSDGDRPNRAEPMPSMPSPPRPSTGERPEAPPPRSRPPRREYESRFEMPPVVVSILPKPKGLSLIVHKIHMAKRAFPMTELASLFLSKPEFCDIKIESRRGEERITIYQCSKCATVSLDRALIESHVIRTHFDEFFDKEETEGEAPGGQFVCVARCGLSGTLLGPPNHHSYAEKVREVHQALYPNMSIDGYRQRIETVRDEELIEKWKEESRKRTVYLPKDKKDAEEDQEPLAWSEAEALFQQKHLPRMVRETHRAVLPASVAIEMDDRRLHRAIGEIWRRENRRPRSLLYALRAAFRHMHLHSFQAGGETFLCAMEPTPLDASHAVDSIREVLSFLQDHPGCTRKSLIEALRPGAGPDSDEAGEILTPLSWLVEKGHIIEFFDGTFSVPRGKGESKEKARGKKKPTEDKAPAPDTPQETEPQASTDDEPTSAVDEQGKSAEEKVDGAAPPTAP